MADPKVSQDKNKSKYVKNSLLSGAGQAFPFENFQSTSLLVPVPPASEVVEDASEVDPFVGQEDTISEQSSATTAVAQTSNTGYSRILSSFTWGSQSKEESQPPPTTSVSSTPRSFSPFVHVPSVQSYSPALFVPESNSQDKLDTKSSSSDSIVSELQARFGHLDTNTKDVQPQVLFPPAAEDTLSFPELLQQQPTESLVTAQLPPPPQSSNFQGHLPTKRHYAPIPSSILQKTHNPVDNVMKQELNPYTSQDPASIPFYQLQETHSSNDVLIAAPLTNQPSADVGLSQIPPAHVNAPPPPSTWSSPSSSSSSYRLGSHRRPTYAPVPGLPVSSVQVAPKAAPIVAPSHPDLFQPVSTCVDTQTPVDLFKPPEMDSEGLNPVDLSAPVRRSPSPSVVPQKLLNLGQSGVIYRPVYHHWFWKFEGKDQWQPFSMNDSLELEQAFNSQTLTANTVVATDGGRYDVYIVDRKREAVYWEEKSSEVRRCSWFYSFSTGASAQPYDENTAYLLEEEYKAAVMSGTWNRRIILNDGDCVFLHGPTSITYHPKWPDSPEGWEGDMTSPHKRARVVTRGVVDKFEIDDGESAEVDHLLLVVHGIGQFCDLKFRKIEEAVNGFRSISNQLLKTHYKSAQEQGLLNRVEILPVSWHRFLHGDATGVDEKLKSITLKSIPKLREFTNDTILDVLFYTSPVYCQKIVNHVVKEMNRMYSLFKQRNPAFQGGVSLCAHSLGSLILFDLLSHQKNPACLDLSAETVVESSQVPHPHERKLNKNVSYVMGSMGTGQPFIAYPQLDFEPYSLFAMGSPIGMFVTVRGIDYLGLDFKLPTCPGFYNIFHPYDPIAYRIEALINPMLAGCRPILIPHHKGRKRMHLELRDTMARMGADLKQRLIDSVRSTWQAFHQLTSGGSSPRSDDNMMREVFGEIPANSRKRTDSRCETEEESATNAMSAASPGIDVAGMINQGRRVDYVLQEAPLESFNEYVSAVTSHLCYWDSEDTVLFILKDIYNNLGVSADSTTQQNQQADEIHHNPLTSPTSPVYPIYVPVTPSVAPVGMDPTLPPGDASNIGPPPTTAFVRY